MSEPLEDLVAEFLLLREADPALTIEAFAARHPARREPLLAALRTALDVDGMLEPDGGRPTAIGRYHVVRELGRGAVGVVYEVEHAGRRLALKLLAAPALLGGRVRERFHREVAVLSRLDHPGIVRVVDSGEHEGLPFLVMECLGDETLADVQAPLPCERAVAICRALADALAVAHAAGVLHRDLKPGNVVLRGDGAPVLVDFGLVAADDDQSLTATGALLGTPRYMSPEQAAGTRVDARSDVYSLGLILYELVSGRTARTGDTRELVLRVVRTGRVPSVAGLPAGLARVLRKCLARRPAWRYAGAAELAADLQRLERGEPVLGRPPGIAVRAVDRVLSAPHQTAAVLGVVAVAAGIAIAILGSRPAPLAEQANEHLRARRFTEAATAFARALDDEPDSAELRFGLARALHGGGEFARGLEVLDAAIASAPPGRPEWRNLRGALLDQLGRRGEAQQEFRHLTREHPDHADYAFNLAYSLDADLKVREARRGYEDVLQRFPDHQRARACLAWLHATAAGEFVDLRDDERAERLALEVLDADRGRTQSLLLTVTSVARATGRLAPIVARLAQLAEDPGASDAVRARLRSHAQSLENTAGR